MLSNVQVFGALALLGIEIRFVINAEKDYKASICILNPKQLLQSPTVVKPGFPLLQPNLAWTLEPTKKKAITQR